MGLNLSVPAAGFFEVTVGQVWPALDADAARRLAVDLDAVSSELARLREHVDRVAAVAARKVPGGAGAAHVAQLLAYSDAVHGYLKLTEDGTRAAARYLRVAAAQVEQGKVTSISYWVMYVTEALQAVLGWSFVPGVGPAFAAAELQVVLAMARLSIARIFQRASVAIADATMTNATWMGLDDLAVQAAMNAMGYTHGFDVRQFAKTLATAAAGAPAGPGINAVTSRAVTALERAGVKGTGARAGGEVVTETGGEVGGGVLATGSTSVGDLTSGVAEGLVATAARLLADTPYGRWLQARTGTKPSDVEIALHTYLHPHTPT
ncbi:hypothetical protein, partial [Enterococcus hirae]|uniref:WXG100-like domain-containing protein n=1 Tax=Enterococcus hirae TaxID=1354 RepID=UPI00137157EA